MIVFPNAKINLGLQITEKRSDGFHNIETVFYPVPIYDILEIIKTKESKSEFSNSGIPINDSGDNLCQKAYRLLSDKFELPSVKIHLHKQIPIGAGLGGGSADATFTLKAINEMFDLQISKSQLEQFSEQLGSDCPFFVRNTPALATGKGEILSPISVNIQDYHVGIVFPKIHISSALAYSNIIPKPSQRSIASVLEIPINEWHELLHNQFEDSVFINYPEIQQIKEKLYKLGAIYASMSGSGSAVYGIFKTPVDLATKFDDKFNYFGSLNL